MTHRRRRLPSHLRKEIEYPLPELPALILIPTAGFERPQRQTDNDDLEVSENAREFVLPAIASELALIELMESFFTANSSDKPTLRCLEHLRSTLEELERSIALDHLDQYPNIDTTELAAMLEAADALVESYSARGSSAGRNSLRFFIEEAKRRSVEIFHIAICSISVQDANDCFTKVEQMRMRYPP